MERGPETSVRLPRGELFTEGIDSLRVVLPVARAERALVRTFFERVASFGAHHGDASLLLAPTKIDEREDDLVLDYACPGTVSFAQASRVWRGDLAARLPSVLALGRALAGAGLALERAGWGFWPLTPPQIRIARAACTDPAASADAPLDPAAVAPRAREVVHLIALPPLPVTLADWTEAEPAAWAWAPPEALYGELRGGTGYAVGAVLHACLAGELWPSCLPPAERFTRLLRGRSGTFPRAAAALATALPKSLADEQVELGESLALLLDPDRSRRPAGEEIRTRLGRHDAALSVRKLAAGWETEGQPQRALDVLDRGMGVTSPDEVAWDVMARLAESLGDLPRALEAGAHGLRGGDAAMLRGYLGLLARVATATPKREALLARAIELFDAAAGSDPGDVARVYLAHFEARHLGRSEAARVRLRVHIANEWCRALGAVIEARGHAEGAQFPYASRAARDGRALLDAAPDGGGRTGRYVRAYLHLIDGIANLGAVSALGDPSFLRDAFNCFTQSLDLARVIDAADLVEANVHWLAHLRAAVSAAGSGGQAVLALGLDAYLGAGGLTDEIRAPRFGAPPGIPWYDEGTLFPAQVATS